MAGGEEDVHRTRNDGRGRDRAPACPRCETSLYRRHCKYVCPNHGVVMDCADTFWQQ